MEKKQANGGRRWRLGLGGGSALLLTLCFLVGWKGVTLPVTGILSGIEQSQIPYENEEDLNRKEALEQSRKGTVFAAPAPPIYVYGNFFMLPVGRESNLELFENDQPMIRESWKGDVVYPGSFFHNFDRIFFVATKSPSSGLSANVYTFHAYYLLRIRYQVGLCLVFVLAGVGLGLAGHSFQPRRSDNAGSGKGWLSRLLNSWWTVLPVASFGALLSFLGRNSFFYSFGEMGTSLSVLAVSTGVLVLGFTVLRFLLYRLAGCLEKRGSFHFVWVLEIVGKILLVSVSGCGFVLCSGMLADEAFAPGLPRSSFFLFSASLVSVLGIVIVLWWGIRGLNALLLSFFVVSGGMFVLSAAREMSRQQVVFSWVPDRKIQFTIHPNVYLFFIESYAGLDALRDLYDIDATPFYRELQKRGFLIRDTWANKDYTIASSATLMAMRHLDFSKFEAGNFDLRSEVRHMISGRIYNPVLDIFKQNGFRISFLQRDFYLFPRSSDAVDVTNLSFEGIRLKHWPLSDATGFFKVSLGDIKNTDANFFENSKLIVRQCLDRPTFHFIYTGLRHNMQQETNREWRSQWKTQYRELYGVFNPKLLDMLDLIEREDPESLIVLIGDHGSKLFGNCGVGSPDYPEFVESGMGDAETLARDKASVLFAIKSPVKSDIWETRPISHVNLFRYLFSMLSGDETLLDHPEPDVSLSWDGKYIIARDGQPLKEWEPVPAGFFDRNRTDHASDLSVKN
jgi:hypothetical protein